MNQTLTVFRQLLRKDLRSLWRAKQMLVTSLCFAVLLVVVASFAFRQIGLAEGDFSLLASGLIWLIFIFTGVIALNHSFSLEAENDALLGVLLSPVDPSLVYLSKAASNALYLFVLQIIILLLLSLFFNLPLFEILGQMLFITAAVAIGFVALGTIFSAMAVCTSSREVFLPLVLFPLCFPLLAAAIYLTRDVFAAGVLELSSFWLLLLLGFDLISIVLAWVLFEHVLRG